MMEVLALLCFFCVPGHAGEEAPPPSATPAGVPDAASESPERLRLTDLPAEMPRRYHPTPPELVAEALMLPAGHSLSGQPIALASALSSRRERAEQLETIWTYWRLAEAVAVYRFQHEYDRRLHDLEAKPEQAARMAAVRAASRARLGEAELRVVAAQHALAAEAGFPPESALPLPADHPHVGQYLTRFRELFEHRSAPPAARRLDRTLPIQFQAIEARASAVAAALDAHQAAGENLQRSGWAEQVDILAELHRLRCEWIGAVGRYNQDIAEYAVAVAPPGTNGAGLVALLIKPAHAPVRPLVSDDTSAVQPASAVEPADAPTAIPRPSTADQPPEARREPTPAVRPPTGEPTPAIRPQADEPTPATRPAEPSEPAAAPDPAGAMQPGGVLPLRPVVPIEDPVPSRQPDADDAPAPADPTALGPALFEADGQPAPLGPEASIPDVQRRTAQRPTAVLPPLYPGLAGASPGVRAKQLNLSLHWNRSLPDASGEPIELADCLQRRRGDRRGLISAYWTVRERAATHQVWQQHRQWLEELSLALPKDSPGAWRLRVAQLEGNASLLAAHAELVEAQFRLAEEIGQSADAVWPLPATRPHSGQYLLKIESLPAELAGASPLRKLADMVPRLSANVCDHAVAVVEADAARVEAEAAWLDGTASFDEVLHTVQQQTGCTLAFLVALTDYNQAIADYALRVLSPDTPDELLVRTLVMPE